MLKATQARGRSRGYSHLSSRTAHLALRATCGEISPLPDRRRVWDVSCRSYIATRRRSQVGSVSDILFPKYPQLDDAVLARRKGVPTHDSPTCPRSPVRLLPNTDDRRREGERIRIDYVGCLLWRAALALRRRAWRAREDVPLQRAIIRNPREGVRGGRRIVFWDSRSDPLCFCADDVRRIRNCNSPSGCQKNQYGRCRNDPLIQSTWVVYR